MLNTIEQAEARATAMRAADRRPALAPKGIAVIVLASEGRGRPARPHG